jgi:2-(1,2-epoxy-1,2-dihydrophenyl)acetyl-CoA isomerase
MKPTQAPVIFRCDGPVARLIFNRPDVLNAFNRECAVALLEACRAIEKSPDVRVVLMKGNGNAFMAGGDVSAFPVSAAEAPAFFRDILEPFHDAIEIMMGLRQPVVAAVHGAVAGGGLSLAMAADLVITADNTKFTMGYSKLGLSADGSGSWSLPRLIGLRRALELALLSDVYSAEDALRFGLVNRVVPMTNLFDEAEALVQRLAQAPTVALGHMKSLMRRSFNRSLKDQLEAERDALVACAVTSDFREGVNAFVNKEAAIFSGT